MPTPYTLTFEGGAAPRQPYRQHHRTLASAEREAARVLTQMCHHSWPRAEHPATISGPDGERVVYR